MPAEQNVKKFKIRNFKEKKILQSGAKKPPRRKRKAYENGELQNFGSLTVCSRHKKKVDFRASKKTTNNVQTGKKNNRGSRVVVQGVGQVVKIIEKTKKKRKTKAVSGGG